ncbi:hypothetical protein Tco_0944562, partial [Tanacetum coccineum]
MEEYIRLKEEKARRHGKVYNWETAKYGKIWYDEDNRKVKIYNLCTNLVDFAYMDLPPRDHRIYDKEVHRVHVFDFGGLTELIDVGLRGRMLMEHIDAQGQSFGEAVLELDTVGALQFQLGGVRCRMSQRQFILGISSARDFLGIAPSYTSIRDPMLRLCHRLIACSIAGRSQAPKK